MGATVGSTTTSYVIDALGQRVKKSSSSGATYFVYDDAGHLIGEYDGSGALVQELVWFGEIPVATLRPKSGGGVDTLKFPLGADTSGSRWLLTRADFPTLPRVPFRKRRKRDMQFEWMTHHGRAGSDDFLGHVPEGRPTHPGSVHRMSALPSAFF